MKGDTFTGFVCIGAVALLVLLFVWYFISSAVGSGVRSANEPPPSPSRRPPASPAERSGFPVTLTADMPGHFKVSGVDRAMKMDTTWHVDAQSEANARAKAELEGIIVTRVDRVG